MASDDSSRLGVETADTKGGGSERPSWDDSPLALNVIQSLIEEHPNWRLTSHNTGRNDVMMIEFADDDGELPSGDLPGEFVSMITNHERGDDE